MLSILQLFRCCQTLRRYQQINLSKSLIFSFILSIWLILFKFCVNQARAGIKEIHFLPFNPTDKRTALTYIDAAGKMHRVSKGAPEQVNTYIQNNEQSCKPQEVFQISESNQVYSM